MSADTTAREMRIYLDPPLLDSARAGTHRFIAMMAEGLTGAGFTVDYLPTGPDARAMAPTLPGWALFHMEQPTHARAAVFRRVYQYPFWAIEPVAERWNWRVARSVFDPALVPRETATAFAARWRKRLYGEQARHTTRDGFVYVPLQGRLLRHRSFQDCAPVTMIERLIAADPARRILATLHPGETYTQPEVEALDRLSRRFPRFEVITRPMADCLRHCDYVATMNSSAAFAGYFFGKPALLHARIDFHHIALPGGAVDRVGGHHPDYDGYIWWFWQKMAVNAGRDEAPRKIAHALRRAGVPV